MLKIGHLVPATVIKALPDRKSLLMLIAGTEIMALLPRVYAGSQLLVGDNTVASVFAIDDIHHRVILSQKSSPFFRRLAELILSPLLVEGKIKVVHAAAVAGAGFAKIAVTGLNGCNPIAECIPYLRNAAGRYTKDTLTLVRYSPDIEEYIASAFAPAPSEDILEVIYFRDQHEALVYVKPKTLGLFIGRRGANVATAAKLTGASVIVKPG